MPYRAIVSGPSRDRLGSSGHTVQRLDTDGDFRHLGMVIRGIQAVFDDRFVPTKRRLNQRSTTVVCQSPNIDPLSSQF